jgi:predicted Holliday junction resolvase-like endonuclease
MIFEILSLILLITCIILVIVLRNIKNKYLLQKEIHKDLKYDYKSMHIKHGKSFEQLFPFMNNYPYESRNFRFIGDPIDGLSFEDGRIVFIEFKTGTSKLSERQKRIKELVENKKVEWKEIKDNL